MASYLEGEEEKEEEEEEGRGDLGLAAEEAEAATDVQFPGCVELGRGGDFDDDGRARGKGVLFLEQVLVPPPHSVLLQCGRAAANYWHEAPKRRTKERSKEGGGSQ